MDHEEITGKIIGCAMKVHSVFGPGFLESVYQNALAIEVRKMGLNVECGRAITVFYDGVTVGQFVADMLIEGCVIVENKAVQSLAIAHAIQLVNYLAATGFEVGLLLNFGAATLEFKRKHRTYQPKQHNKPEEAVQRPDM